MHRFADLTTSDIFLSSQKERLSMRKWLYKKALTIFLGALALYILIWCTVSYVGVQVTYVLGPIILVSGLIAYFCSPAENSADI
jgi:hypothetical protein